MQWAIFIVLSAIFFITPYQKGLYFSYSLYSTGIFLSILFILVVLLPFIKKENTTTKGIVIFLLPMCLIISLPFASSPKGAWDSLIKWLFYAEFFYLLLWASLKPSIKKLMPLLFQINGVFLALFTILNFYGVFDYRAAILNERFAGVFQYPNTFGMVMALFYMFSLIQLSSTKMIKRIAALYSSSLILFFCCFILSFSRGMLLIIPLVWLLGLVLLPTLNQLKYTLYTIISVSLSLMVYQSIESGKSFESPYPGLLAMIITVLLMVGLSLLFEFYYQKIFFGKGKILSLVKAKYSRFGLPAFIMITLLFGFLDFTNDGLIFRSFPERLQERISGISLSAATAQERIFLYEDALTMSKDSPIFGFGGAGWASIYQKYQHIPYQSNKIHNGYLEWLVDTGWLGLIIFLCVFAYMINLVYRSRKSEQQDSTLHIAVIVSFLAAAIHSLLDFNYSFGTVMLIIFWLVAMGISYDQSIFDIKSIEKLKIKKFTLIIGSFSLILVSMITMYKSYNYQGARQTIAVKGNVKSFFEEESILLRTIKKDPDNTKYYINLSNQYLQEPLLNSQTEKNVVTLVEKMTAVEPNNSNVLHKSAQLSAKIGNTEKTLKFYNQALKVDHFNTRLYEDSIKWKIKTALKNKQSGNQTLVTDLLTSALKDYQQAIFWEDDFRKRNLGNEFNSRKFSISNEIIYYTSIAFFLTNDFDHAIELSNKINKKHKLYVNSVALQIISLEKNGNLKESNELFSNNEKIVKNLNDKVTEFVNILY